MKKMNKNLEYYLNLEYPIEIKKLKDEDGGGFLATIPLLGRNVFLGDGETIEEALENLNETKKDWFEIYLKEGIEIKEPEEIETREYSGRLLLRIPKNLHRDLDNNAKQNDISLNQYLIYLLSTNIEKFENNKIISGIHRSIFMIKRYFDKMQYDYKEIKKWQEEHETNNINLNNYIEKYGETA